MTLYSPDYIKYTFIYRMSSEDNGDSYITYWCQPTLEEPSLEEVNVIQYEDYQPTFIRVVKNTFDDTNFLRGNPISKELHEVLTRQATQQEIDDYTGYIIWVGQHAEGLTLNVFIDNIRKRIPQYATRNPYIIQRINYIFKRLRTAPIPSQSDSISKADALELLTCGILKKKERLTSRLDLIYKDYRLDIVELTEKPQYRKAALVSLVKEHFTKDYLNPALLKNYKRLRILLCQYWNIKEPTIGEKQVRDYNNGAFISNIKSECNSLW